MLMKVPNVCGNSFGGTSEETSEFSDHDEDVIEFSSEDERTQNPNDFSDFLWMENEDDFESEVFEKLEEQELIEECLEAFNEMTLLDEIREISEAEEFFDSVQIDVQNSKLNPNATPFFPFMSSN